MRFLFVNLDWPGLVSKKTYKIHLALPPLDLIVMSNFARDLGHEAEIFDCFVQDSSKLSAALPQADWVIIATTPYHMWQCPNSDWEWVKKTIALYPKDKIVLSGLHASVFPEQTLRETGVAAVIKREPEVVYRNFLQTKDWKQTEGACVLSNGRYFENKVGKLPELDELAVKDYSVDIANYGYFLLGRKTGLFEASRGCPWKCTFCDQEMHSWLYRLKAPEVFANEVKQAIQRTGMETAYFYDLEFSVNRKRTLEICQELLKAQLPKKFRWCCQTRADTVDEEVLEAMKDAGCVLIHYGVESANPKILKETNKKITLEKIEHGVTLTKKMKLQTACFFMFGLPGETPAEFDNTLEFARSLNPTYASFHFAIPFPGTPLYDLYLKERNLPWGVWPATYFHGWPHPQIQAYIRSAYQRFYLLPRRFELQEFRFRLQNLQAKLAYFRSAAV